MHRNYNPDHNINYTADHNSNKYVDYVGYVPFV